MWDKAYLLAFMLVGSNFVGGLLIGLLEIMFRTKLGGLAGAVQFTAAYTLGQLYTQNRGVLISKALKLQISAYYILISTCVISVLLIIMNEPKTLGLFPVLALLGLVSALGFTMIYWGLSSGSKAYMKRTRK